MDANTDHTGPYRFKFVDLAASTPLTLGTPITVSTLAPGNDTTAYQFSAASGAKIFLDVQQVLGGDATWRVIDRFGRQVASTTSDLDTLTLTTGGTYMLLVEGAISNTAPRTYSFNLQTATEETASLTLGSQTTGSISTPGQQDHFTFTLADRASLYFDALTNASAFTWALAGPRGIEVSARTFTSADADALTGNPLLNLVAGDYTLTIDGIGDVTGAYAFRLLDAAAATALSLDTPVTGQLGNKTELYQFTVAGGTRLFFDVQTLTGTAPAWRLVNAAGGVVFGTAIMADTGPVTLNVAGTYFLLVEGRIGTTNSASYTLQVHTVTDTQAGLNLGATTNGSIGIPGQQNRFTFTLNGAAQLYFDALTNSAAFTWTLSGPRGVEVDARTFTSTDGTAFAGNPVRNLVAGNYTLTVDATGDVDWCLRIPTGRCCDGSAADPGNAGGWATHTREPNRPLSAQRSSRRSHIPRPAHAERPRAVTAAARSVRPSSDRSHGFWRHRIKYPRDDGHLFGTCRRGHRCGGECQL